MSKAVRITEHVDGGWYEGDPPVWHDYPKKGEVGVFTESQAENLVGSGRGEYVRESRAKDEKRPDPAGGEQRAGARAAGGRA